MKTVNTSGVHFIVRINKAKGGMLLYMPASPLIKNVVNWR